jgi:hypothetical protein
MTPMQVCEALIGPAPMLSQILGYHRTAGYGWHQAATTRDAGDLPSTRIMRALLAHAAKNEIPLRPDHLIWGARRSEIEALVGRKAAA